MTMNPDETRVIGQDDDCMLLFNKPVLVKIENHGECDQTSAATAIVLETGISQDTSVGLSQGLVQEISTLKSYDLDVALDCSITRKDMYEQVAEARIKNENDRSVSQGDLVESTTDGDAIRMISVRASDLPTMVTKYDDSPAVKVITEPTGESLSGMGHMTALHYPGDAERVTNTAGMINEAITPQTCSATPMDVCDTKAIDVRVKKEVEIDGYEEQYRQLAECCDCGGSVDISRIKHCHGEDAANSIQLSSGVINDSESVDIESDDDDVYDDRGSVDNEVELGSGLNEYASAPEAGQVVDAVDTSSARAVSSDETTEQTCTETITVVTAEDDQQGGNTIAQQTNTPFKGKSRERKDSQKKRRNTDDSENNMSLMSMSIHEYEQYVHNLYTSNIIACQGKRTIIPSSTDGMNTVCAPAARRRKHSKSVTRDYPCSVCGRQFAKKKSLELHKGIHVNVLKKALQLQDDTSEQLSEGIHMRLPVTVVELELKESSQDSSQNVIQEDDIPSKEVPIQVVQDQIHSIREDDT